MRLILWVVYVLILAGATHAAILHLAPYRIMDTALSRIGAERVNTMLHSEPPTAQSRVIVAPSPDLLYSVCPFDLTTGPLDVTTGAALGTYWSVAVYAHNTDNIFVRNDLQANGSALTLRIEPPQTARHAAGTQSPASAVIVKSPSVKGLVLIRTLVNDETRRTEIDAERRKATCKTAAP